MCWKRCITGFRFSLCVFLCMCITTVTPSRVYKLLPLPHCLSIGGSESCVYAGSTRCWFNRWTDDRLSQKLRRQIHSPTLSRLPPRFFSACFVYIRLSLSHFLFLARTISMFWLFFSPRFSLAHSHGLATNRVTNTLSLSSFCVWILIVISLQGITHCKLANYDFKTVVKQQWMLLSVVLYGAV